MQYLLWDHDGVLVDTERWYFEATRIVLGHAGIELSEADYLRRMATGRGSWHLLEQQGYSAAEIAACRDERNAIYQDFIRTRDIEIEHVDEVLESLAVDFRMAIVTTARRVDFDLIHAERDIVRHFEFTLTVEDYPRAKPHPDPYQAALDRFGANAGEAVAIEDTSRGLAAARAAGLPCVVIAHPFTAAQDFTDATRIVEGIRDVPAAVAELKNATLGTR
jgi:HAD superfamily hydrolase (TIGR01509 family)